MNNGFWGETDYWLGPISECRCFMCREEEAWAVECPLRLIRSFGEVGRQQETGRFHVIMVITARPLISTINCRSTHATANHSRQSQAATSAILYFVLKLSRRSWEQHMKFLDLYHTLCSSMKEVVDKVISDQVLACDCDLTMEHTYRVRRLRG